MHRAMRHMSERLSNTHLDVKDIKLMSGSSPKGGGCVKELLGEAPTLDKITNGQRSDLYGLMLDSGGTYEPHNRASTLYNT